MVVHGGIRSDRVRTPASALIWHGEKKAPGLPGQRPAQVQACGRASPRPASLVLVVACDFLLAPARNAAHGRTAVARPPGGRRPPPASAGLWSVGQAQGWPAGAHPRALP